MDIDLYCERISPGLWQEPLNTVSNLAFFISAWMVYRLLSPSQRKEPGLLLSLFLLIGIGFGSTLFHGFGTRETALLDVIPIALFQLWYLWLYSRRAAALRPPSAAAVVAAFLLLGFAVSRIPPAFNHSTGYAPALIVLLGLALHASAQKHHSKSFVFAAGLFFLSLVFRSLDNAVCGALPIGTHFVWHLLNATVLYLLLRGLLDVVRPSAEPR